MEMNERDKRRTKEFRHFISTLSPYLERYHIYLLTHHGRKWLPRASHRLTREGYQFPKFVVKCSQWSHCEEDKTATLSTTSGA